MNYKNPVQLVNSFNDDDIYNEWEGNILTEERKNKKPYPMATRMADTPYEPMDVDEFRKSNYDKDLIEKVIGHRQKYEGLVDRYGSDIESVANPLGGQMVGLEYRLKRPDSLARKIGVEMDEQRKAGNQNFSYDDALKTIKDTSRFTVVYDPENFERNVYSTIDELKKRGYNITKFKNQFTPDSQQYRGLNTNFRDKDGNLFELQFHIPQSMRAKEGIDVDLPNRTVMLNKQGLTSHDYYETTRVLENKISKGVATEREKRLYELLTQRSVDHWRDIPFFDLKYDI